MTVENGVEILSVTATSLFATIGAVGALGTAAFGLVDASKVFGGGIANVGFGHVRNALAPFGPALANAVGEDWLELVRAHWRNGKPKPEQKAIAVALIQLGLTSATAGELAAVGHVDGGALQASIEKLVKGAELDASEINTLSRFKTAIEAKLDAAYERAEQQYRNWARVAAGAVAIVLSVVGGFLLYRDVHSGTFWQFVGDDGFARSLMVGIIAVPIAPIAKDLISSLSAAVRAVKAAKSG